MSTNYAQFIKALRIKRGFSQLRVAERLGMSRPSYIAVEKGKRELTLSEAEKLCAFLGITLRELEQGQAQDFEKYRQMILSFLRLHAKIPKTKLAKLLYLADAGWFYYHLESMSGMQYRKIQYGPVAESYFRIIDELYNNGQIEIEQTDDGAMLISETRGGAKSPLPDITREESQLMRDIGKKWFGRKTKEIVEFTHRQLPYMCAGENETISLGLITQEDPHEFY